MDDERYEEFSYLQQQGLDPFEAHRMWHVTDISQQVHSCQWVGARKMQAIILFANAFACYGGSGVLGGKRQNEDCPRLTRYANSLWSNTIYIIY